MNRIKRGIIPTQSLGRTMAVHRISFAGAVLLLLLAIVFWVLIGPVGLLVLILVGVLLWYAFGPGARTMTSG